MAAFAGEWVDACKAGECKGFDKFCKAYGMSDEEIKGYKEHVGRQTVIVDGEDWTYITSFGDYKATNKFKIGRKNAPDRDIEGNLFESTPTLINDKEMKEVIETQRPGGTVTTIVKRKIVAEGKQEVTMIHEASNTEMISYALKQ
ncbi:uncharacterized protein [Argopecten irradians]|uniref:uncharacterized protein n=1 Tax=Argopecten irradians TaxID=31199 RepID=UPI00371AE988